MDGKCDKQCDNPGCLFDGRDCEAGNEPCNPVFDAYCRKHYANNHCDTGCNNAGCNWDGLDCERQSPPNLAEGAMSVVVLMDEITFKKNVQTFLREVGIQLRTSVRVKEDQLGNAMIYPWKLDSPMMVPDGGYGGLSTFAMGSSGIIVYLEIDNRMCFNIDSGECFETANAAADYLGASAVSHAFPTTFPIYQVRGVTSIPDNLSGSTNAKYVFIGVILVLVMGLFAWVFVATKKKRAHGVTWFPDGFFGGHSTGHRGSRRRGPDGQEMKNLNKGNSMSPLDTELPGGGGMGLPHHGQWSDDESEMSPRKRMRVCDQGYASDHTVMTEYGEQETRPWTQTHLDAADLRQQGLLSPPDEKHNVDARGPMGMTPLMVAAARGCGIDTGEDECEDDGTAQVITDLVGQGAELNATMEKTGETSLHLAARYARADAAKRLLDAGAEANVQDNTGRTPLHAAVAADAMGVFQILLRNRATNLNAKMHDGTTPLILAARLAIEGMVEDLISAEADINAADNNGKTALHWAAAVNNVDAVNILLAHCANRDAQDDKDETPLFLAAREGSYEASKALLDNFANREITDHMDRLPRDVASERLHQDIVRLLDEHVARSPQMATIISSGALIGSPNHQQHLITHPTVITASGPKSKAKKRPKSTLNNNSPTSPEIEGAATTVRRKPSIKRQGIKKECHESMSLASPLDSLESPQTVASLGADSLPSPYDSASLYSNAFAQLASGALLGKQPPSYEESAATLQTYQALGLDPNYPGFPLPYQQPVHQRQTSMPVPGSHTLSPPYSNHQSPGSQLTLSPGSLSPGTSSPSPAKSRPGHPLSPTHIQAMRAATHVKHGGFDFADVPPQIYSMSSLQPPQFASKTGNNSYSSGMSTNGGNKAGKGRLGVGMQGGNVQHQYYHYLTPPSQHSNEDCSPASPDSLGGWSTTPSPRSDWSDGLASSPSAAYNSLHQLNKGQEVIYH